MDHIRDPDYLRKEQYKDGSRLDIRASLHNRFSTATINWMDWVYEFILSTGAKNILEVGSGTGKLWNRSTSDLPKNSNILLSDFSWGIINDAKAKISSGNQHFFTAFNAQQLPLAKSSKDLIIANHMLYHIPDLKKALKEFVRVLQKDGTLICATNGLKHMTKMATWAQEALDPTRSEKDYLANWEKAIGGFSINNGESILNMFFEQVEYFPFKDKLVIDDSRAIVDYLASSSLHQINEKEQETLFHHLEKILDSKKVLEVGKQSGLFLATNALL